MNGPENKFPNSVELPDADGVEQGAEAAEQNPAAEAEALSTRLDAIVAENNNLEVAVDGTVREASFDYAVDHHDAVVADTRTILEALPKDDGEKAAALAKLTEEASVNARNMSPEEAQGYVSQLCQEYFGGSLADVLSAAGELVVPETTILKDVMKGEMPKGKDVAKLAVGVIAPPLGRIILDMVWQSKNPTPAEIKRAAIQGKIGSHLIRLVGWALPEVAVVTEPAAKVMDNVNEEVTKNAQREGGSTAADRAKAIGRGLTKDPEQLKKLAEGMGAKMSNEVDLAKAGIDGDTAEFSKAFGRMMSEDPDTAGKMLHDIFRDDGGIVEQPQDFTTVFGSDGGIAPEAAGRPDSAI